MGRDGRDGRVPLAPTCQASAPRGTTPPQTRGSGCWRAAGLVSPRLCCQQGQHAQLDPKATGSSSSLVLSGTQCRQGQEQAAGTAFLKGCTGPGQLQARLTPPASSIWHESLLILTSQHGSSPHSRGNGSSDWHRGLRTHSCHSQSFPTSPSCSCTHRVIQPSPEHRRGMATSPRTPLKHNMRLQQQALQKHLWRVMSLSQTAANSKPSEMTVRAD